MNAKTGFKRFIALILSFAISLSAFTGLSLGSVVSAADSGTSPMMHVIVNHRHTTNESGTVTNNIATFDCYITEKGDSYTLSDDTNTGSFVAGTGVLTVKANPYGPDEKPYESFAGFSVSAGHLAVDTHDEADTPYLEIKYNANTPLVKIDILYKNESKYVSGDTDEHKVVGSDKLEQDVGFVYVDKSGKMITDAEGNPITEENINATANLQGAQEKDKDAHLIKVYSTTAGLHTDKTATLSAIDGDLNDGRTFDLELESWYVGAKAADVGMILDASGSMASPAPSNDKERLEPIYIGEYVKELESVANANSGKIIDDKGFLLTDALDVMLDKNKTDNSPLGVSGYSYYLFDAKSSTNDFFPIGYWDYAEPNPVLNEKLPSNEKNILGFYDFKSGQKHGRGRNVIAELNGSSKVKAYQIDKTSISNINFDVNTKEDFSADNFKFSSERLNVSAGDETIANNKAMLLDVKPTGNNFTLSFSVYYGSDPDGNTQDNQDEILYIGPLKPTDKDNYFQLYRGGSSSGNRLKAGSDGKNKTNIASINNVFSNGTYKEKTKFFVTVVFEDKTVTVYLNGETPELNPRNDKNTGTIEKDITEYNIIFNGFTDEVGSNQRQIEIDDIVLIDESLDAEKVKSLYDNCQKGSNAILTYPTYESVGDYYIATDSEGNVIGAEDKSYMNPTKGWYYVTFSSGWGDRYNNADVGTGKDLRHIHGEDEYKTDSNYYDLVYYYDYDAAKAEAGTISSGAKTVPQSLPGKVSSSEDFKKIPSKGAEYTETDKLIDLNLGTQGNAKNKIQSYYEEADSNGRVSRIVYNPANGGDSNNCTPLKFFVDPDGYLCCFFSNNHNSNKMDDGRYGWSYVFKKNDDVKTKVEALQQALNTFSTGLLESSPSSKISATRFSTADITEADIDNFVLLDWTSDPKEANSILSLERGEGKLKGSTTGYDDGDVDEYNYGLTGGTMTENGIKAYTTYLSTGIEEDLDADKYLIIFTDGKDTSKTIGDYSGEVGENFAKAITEANAYKDVKELKEAGYKIYCVMLTGGAMQPGSDDYDKALQFLTYLSSDCPDEEKGETYNPKKPIADYKYVLSGTNTKELEAAFRAILDDISSDLTGYTVQDYIDPRFDFVDADGKVWHLNAKDEKTNNGKVVIEGGDSFPLPGDGSAGKEITLFNPESETNGYQGEGKKATLYFDKDSNMYYLKWEDCDIPSCRVGDPTIPVWNARVTVRAKDDFIGGNAVLTNGNGANQNYVYMNTDSTRSSGTGNAENEYIPEDNSYPSKGFPRTAVNIAVPTIEMPSGEQVIYMGEKLTPDGIAEKLGEIIRDYIGEEEVDDPDYFNSKSWYWEYLMRYANYPFPEKKGAGDTEDYNYPNYYVSGKSAEENFESLLHALVTSGKTGVDIPYFYLPFDGKYQTGSADRHERDVLGVLHFTWTDVDTGFAEYPTDGTTTDTKPRQSKLTVTYTPVPISRSSAESPTGKRREDYNRDIVQDEKDADGKSIYGWNSEFKPAPGEEAKEDNIKAEGTFRTYIVKGEIVMFLELNKSDLEYLNQHNLYDTSNFIYSAKLKNGKTEIGTFVWDYTTKELAARTDYNGIIRAPAKFEYAKDFDGDTEDVKGLPTGNYTIELDSSPKAPTPFKFEEKIDVLSLSKLPEGITVSNYKTWENVYKKYIKEGKVTEINDFSEFAATNYALGTSEDTNEPVLEHEDDNPSGKVIKQTTIPSYTKERYGLAKITGGLEKGSLKITKEVEDNINEAVDSGKDFEFTVTLKTSEGKSITGTFGDVTFNDDGEATVSLKAGESITISDLPAGANYTIEEKSADGYTSSVKPGEGVASGTIVAGSEKAVTFVNKYSADGTATVKLEKEILGRVFNDSEKKDGFSFDIETADSEADYTGVTIDGKEVTKGTPYTVAVKENGLDVTFKFTKLGEYAFTIKEQENADDDLIEDPKVVTVTFKVTDPERNGKLNVETKYSSDSTDSNNGIDQPNNTITFTNKAFVTWTPTVTKTLNGRDWQDGDVFKFNMKLVKAEPKAVLGYTDENAVKLEDNPVAEATKDNTTAEFNEVTFYSEGTYTFEVSEVKPSDEDAIPGIDYDENKYTIIVTVGIDENTGRLTVKSDENKPIATFENNYTVDVTASVGTEISKELTGRDWLGTDEFTFELVADPSDEATVDAVNAGIIELPEAVTVTKKGEDVQFKNITFKGVVLDKVGEAYTKTYNFIIKEQSNPSSKGITYDTTTYPVEVKITLKDGTATAVVTANDAVTFENSYSADKTTWAPTVTKTLNGRDWQTGDVFTFNISPNEKYENVEMPSDTTVTVKYDSTGEDDHTAQFGAITFTKAGVYKFEVRETEGNIAGITYDNTVYTVTVTVTDAGGQLTAKVAYSDNKGNADLEEISFTNTYTPAKTSPVSVSATKELTENGKPVKVEAGKFSFTVTPDSDNPENDPVKGGTVTNEAGGAIKLITDAVYTAAGEYKYTVAEEGGNDKAHYTYDDTVYTVTVTVTDVDGQLTAKVAYSDNKGNADLEEISFTNTYTPDPVPDVKIEKTQFVGPNATAETATTEDLTVKPGDTVTYFLTVTNTVEGSVAENVEVTDKIPEGLVLVKNSISYGGENKDGTITWSIDKLEFNKPAVLSFKVTVPDEAKEASWSNFATVKYPNPDDPDNPNTDDSNHVTINEPAPEVKPTVTVVKTQAVGDGTATAEDLTVEPGDTVTYFLTVSASGGSEGSIAEGIKVTDKIPEGLKLVEGSISNGGENKGGIITWTVDVANGDSVVLSFKVTVPEVGEEPVSNTTRSWKNAAQFNGTDTNTVTVTENLGNLRITKRVSGNDGDRTEAFRFTLGIYTDSVNKTSVAISDTAAFTITGSDNKPVGSAEFVNGVCEFMLAHGQSLTVSGLPAGAYFEVKEIDSGEGYETKANVNGDSKNVITGTDGSVIASGTIAENSTVTASFNNYRHKTVQTGSLTVRKTVASPNLDPDAVYTFGYTLTLPQYSEEPSLTYRITGIYGESGGSGRLRPDSIIPDAAGRLIVAGTFTLKHNQKIVISGIPVDTGYEVRENVPAGYTLSTYKDTGTVSATERNQTAVFVNTEYIPGSLTVSKTAIGSEASPWSFFDFVVTLYNDADMTEIATDISGFYGDEVTYKGMLFENGVAYVTLSDGESCTATGLPGNLYYTVVETDNGEGYTPELAIPVGQTPLLAFNTPNVFDVPPAPDGTAVPDEPAADEPVADGPVAEPVVTDEPMPADEMSGEPVASESDNIPDGTTTADEPVLPDETAPNGNYIPFDLPMPIDEPAYGPTVSGAITPTTTGTASFVNVKNVDVDVRTGELVIEKQVTGHGDREYGFGFKVEFFTDATFLTDVTADNYADIYAVVIKDTPGAETEGEEFVEISAGIGTFNLRDGESVCIGGIPDGTYFRVTEYDADGHTVSVTGDCITLDEYSVYGTVSGDDSAHVIFNNNLPENHAVPVDATLKITKSFSKPGATSRGDLTFNFTITEDSEGSTPKTDRVTVYSGENNPEETGTSHGITLSFPEAGTYTYSVKEESISDDADIYEGITTVGEPVKVVINVAANADGTLYIASATVDGKSVADTKLITVSFVNPYEPPATEPDEPEPATAELKIEKSFSAPGATSRGDLTFNFKVTKDTEESSTPVSVTVKKDAETGTSDDAVKLSFDAAGEYTYYVSEEPISDDADKYEGITTVAKPVKVVINVAANADGTLYIASATVDGEPVADTKLITVSFVNSYEPPATEPDEPEPAAVELKIEKSFSAPGATSRGDLTFNFKVTKDTEESSTPVSVTVKKDAETGTSDDAVKLSFDAAGEYTYYVSEEPISDDADKYEGITTVAKPVKVVINVAANADGTLYIASATVDGKSVADTKLITVSFVNPYEPPATEPDEPEPATGSLTLSKVLYINNRIVRGVGQFRFRIELDSDFTGGRFSNGVAEVVLAAGESITLEGLPAGARYTVSEYNTYGYTLLVRESTGLSGTIPEDGEAKAAAVNVRVETWQPSAPPIGGPVGGEPPAETPEVEPPTEAGQTDEDGVEGSAPSAGFLSGVAALLLAAGAVLLFKKRRSAGK